MDDILISPVVATEELSEAKVPPVVPQPSGTLLDFGLSEPEQPTSKEAKSSPVEDLFSDFTAPPPPAVSAAKTSSGGNIDLLFDAPNHSSNHLMDPCVIPMMKTSSSAENFTNSSRKNNDPFGDLLAPSSTSSSSKNTADDLVSKMLNDLDLNPGKGGKSAVQQPNAKPNYNVSFNGNQTKNQAAATNHQPKVSANTFEDLLGPGFNLNNGGMNKNDGGKSIGEMKKAEVMKSMTAEEAKVFAWKDGKSRNLRALLCSLHTVIWPNSRWSQCGMHQLVSENDVNRMYKKACLAVHPDKQMGTQNEELSKLIFIELNDAWAEFNKDS